MVKIQCARVTPISKGQQAKAADELDALPADSILGTVIVPDWVQMRDKARACGSKATS